MAHAFDNRNFVSNKQQTFCSIVPSISSSKPDITNSLWDTSSSPRSSPKPNHPPPSYEESVLNKNHHRHSPSTSDDSTYRQRQQPLTGKNHACLHCSLSSNFTRE